MTVRETLINRMDEIQVLLADMRNAAEGWYTGSIRYDAAAIEEVAEKIGRMALDDPEESNEE